MQVLSDDGVVCLLLVAGKTVIVDSDEMNCVRKYTLRMTRAGYVAADIYMGYRKPYICDYLHRVILGAKKGDEIDHINNDPLDNRKCNLRLASRSLNEGNKPPRKGTSSKYKGVSLDGKTQKWRAQISVGERHINIGRFDDEREAAMAYDAQAEIAYKEFAWLNKNHFDLSNAVYREREGKQRD